MRSSLNVRLHNFGTGLTCRAEQRKRSNVVVAGHRHGFILHFAKLVFRRESGPRSAAMKWGRCKGEYQDSNLPIICDPEPRTAVPRPVTSPLTRDLHHKITTFHPCLQKSLKLLSDAINSGGKSLRSPSQSPICSGRGAYSLSSSSSCDAPVPSPSPSLLDQT